MSMSRNESRRDFLNSMISGSAASLVSTAGFGKANAESLPAGIPQRVVDGVRERIHQALARGESTGVAVAVVSSDRIVWEEGFGWADREKGIKITPRSPFNLESVTKTFTATLLTTLAAEGKLNLDQPANLYLGQSKITGTNGDPEKATVRLLGAHASGLPGTYGALYGGVQSPPPSVFLRNYGRLAYPPARIWEYSNVAFEALGSIAWNLTGTDFGILMAKRVLSPLGLRNSFWDTDTARISEGVPRYGKSGKKLPFHVTTTPPSGELLASAHDMATFAMWNMKLRLSGGAQLLNDHWIDELHKPAFVGPTGATTTFGWALDRLSSGETVIHKGGGGPGASTIVCLIPERKLACVVLNNHSTEDLTNSVCDQILGSYLPDWKMPRENGDAPQTPFVVSDAVAGLWMGTLMNDGITMPIELNVASDEAATLALGSDAAENLVELRSEGPALLGKGRGIINSPDLLGSGARLLRIKVIPYEGRLVGRITAVDELRNTFPYVVSLNRVTKR